MCSSDLLEDARTGRLMGSFAQETADKYGITREEMDAYAIESLKRAQAAIQSGELASEIVPVTVTSRKGEVVVKDDEQPLTANLDKLHAMSKLLLEYETIDVPQIDAIMEGREPPPPAGWSKPGKDGGPNDKGGDPRPLPPIAGPAEQH